LSQFNNINIPTLASKDYVDGQVTTERTRIDTIANTLSQFNNINIPNIATKDYVDDEIDDVMVVVGGTVTDI